MYSTTSDSEDEGVSSTEEEEGMIPLPFKGNSLQKGKTKILARKSEIRVGDINVLVTGSPYLQVSPYVFKQIAMLSSGTRFPPWHRFPSLESSSDQSTVETSDSVYPSDMSRKNSESSCITDEGNQTEKDDLLTSFVPISEMDSFLINPETPLIQEQEAKEILWTPKDFEAVLSLKKENSKSLNSDSEKSFKDTVPNRNSLPLEASKVHLPRVTVKSSPPLPRVHIDPILSRWRPTGLQHVEKAGFRLRIAPGTFYELDGCNYVLMHNGTNYTVTVRNLTALRCHADLYVDGMLSFRLFLSAGDSVDLEGPQSSSERFLFLRALDAPPEAKIDPESRNNGLVKCIFTPEAIVTQGIQFKDQYRAMSCSGATALQGYQRPQKFVTDFEKIIENPEGAVIIILRLVTTTDDDGKPSKEFPIHPLQTPEPPPAPLGRFFSEGKD